jgi:hypothetical protein
MRQMNWSGKATLNWRRPCALQSNSNSCVQGFLVGEST